MRCNTFSFHLFMWSRQYYSSKFQRALSCFSFQCDSGVPWYTFKFGSYRIICYSSVERVTFCNIFQYLAGDHVTCVIFPMLRSKGIVEKLFIACNRRFGYMPNRPTPYSQIVFFNLRYTHCSYQAFATHSLFFNRFISNFYNFICSFPFPPMVS